MVDLGANQLLDFVPLAQGVDLEPGLAPWLNFVFLLVNLGDLIEHLVFDLVLPV